MRVNFPDLIAIVALILSLVALVQSAIFQRRNWSFEIVQLASEAAARARTCSEVSRELKPNIDALFGVNGMTGSSLRAVYLDDIETRLKRAVAIENAANVVLESQNRFFLRHFKLADRFTAAIALVQDIRGIESSLSRLNNQILEELLDARARVLKS